VQACVHLQVVLMDDLRLSHRPNAESAYSIFYQFLAGASATVRYVAIHYSLKMYWISSSVIKLD